MTTNPAPGYAQHPEHVVEIRPACGRVKISLDGVLMAETGRGLALTERGYPLRLYVPMADVRAGALTLTERTSYCPFKGQASYWTLEGHENVVWGYEAPYDEVLAIKDHVCFDDATPGLKIEQI